MKKKVIIVLFSILIVCMLVGCENSSKKNLTIDNGKQQISNLNNNFEDGLELAVYKVDSITLSDGTIINENNLELLSKYKVCYVFDVNYGRVYYRLEDKEVIVSYDVNEEEEITFNSMFVLPSKMATIYDLKKVKRGMNYDDLVLLLGVPNKYNQHPMRSLVMPVIFETNDGYHLEVLYGKALLAVNDNHNLQYFDYSSTSKNIEINDKTISKGMTLGDIKKNLNNQDICEFLDYLVFSLEDKNVICSTEKSGYINNKDDEAVIDSITAYSKVELNNDRMELVKEGMDVFQLIELLGLPKSVNLETIIPELIFEANGLRCKVGLCASFINSNSDEEKSMSHRYFVCYKEVE